MSFQYLTVRIGTMWYGIPLSAIIEVLHMVALAELPESGADVLGLLTLRNQIMPVVDLRLRFHQTNTQLHLSTPIIAVRTTKDQQMIGFVVDEVDSVIALSTDTPIKGTSSPYIEGAVQLESYVLLILDIASFFMPPSQVVIPKSVYSRGGFDTYQSAIFGDDFPPSGV